MIAVSAGIRGCQALLAPADLARVVGAVMAGITTGNADCTCIGMIRKLKSGEYRLYSRKLDPKSGKRRNLGTFGTREEAEKHERAVQYFKRAH